MTHNELQCPSCKGGADKVLYFGLPMKLCQDSQCSALWGFWSWVVEVYFNGWFWHYEGAYLPALWDWLTAPLDED